MNSSIPNHAIARIFAQEAARRVPVGAGFLVSPRYLLTCAHVVEAALGLKNAAAAPTPFVAFDFPLLPKHAPLRARVARWLPMCDQPTPGAPEDIALLDIAPETPLPPDARPIDLLTLPDGHYAGRVFRAYGLPERMEDDGDWTGGTLDDLVASGRVQLRHDVGRRAIERDFSGAAVWDEREEAALGMIVAIRGRDELASAYMIPAALLLAACPEIESCAGHARRTRRAEIPPDLLRFHEQALNLKQESAAFLRIITGEDVNTRLLLIHGESGMSKSHLLGLYEQTARAYDLNVFRLDWRDKNPPPVETFLYQLTCRCGGSRHFPHYTGSKAAFAHLAGEAKWEALTEQFFLDLGEGAKIPPLLLLIDTFERAERAFASWLTQIFLPPLAHQQTLTVVIAGQEETPTPAGLEGSCQRFHLRGVPLPECEQYARKLGRQADILAKVHHALRGRPMDVVSIVQSSPLMQEAQYVG